MFGLALASERVRATDPRDGPWLRPVAIEPPRSIAGEFDGNVMVDIARTHPSLTDPDITLPSQIPWKPFGRPHDLMTRAQVRRRHTMSEWLNDGVVAQNHSVRTPHRILQLFSHHPRLHNRFFPGSHIWQGSQTMGFMTFWTSRGAHAPHARM